MANVTPRSHQPEDRCITRLRLVADALLLRNAALTRNDPALTQPIVEVTQASWPLQEAVLSDPASDPPAKLPTPTLDQEVAFLTAYASLQKAMWPITADTLRSSRTRWYRKGGGMTPEARALAFGNLDEGGGWRFGRFWQWLFFLIALFVMVVALIWADRGKAALDDHDVLACQQDIVNRYLERVLSKAAAPIDAEAAASEPCRKRPGVLEPAQRLIGLAGGDADRLRYEASLLQQQRDRATRVLTEWSQPICRLPGLRALCPVSEAVDSARATLAALQGIILPMLLGLLGAYCVVLQSMSAAIRALTFQPGSSLQYLVRLSLGALTGIVVGWFIDPSTSAMAGVSAVALSFVAGYGADYFFQLIDRVMLSLTGATPTSPAGRTSTERS